MEIIIREKEISINGVELDQPCFLKDLEIIFGKSDAISVGEKRTTHIWNNIGISSLIGNTNNAVIDLRIKLKKNELKYIPSENCFEGDLLIDDKNYIQFFKVTKNDHIFKDFELGLFTGTACLSKDTGDIVAVMIEPIIPKKRKTKENKYQINKVENSVTEFQDFNFKLSVIQQLMYDMDLLKPKLDMHEFVECFEGKKINLSDYDYKLIPEIKEYLEKLPIPIDMLELVEEIYQDGGNEIYMNMIGFWDGEDEMFNIRSTEDLQFVPNLKSITLFYDEEEEMADKFAKKGINAEYL